ncbi:MAG: hypothetical protein AB1646_09185 [Thermodesulfobacteriota bacterium]
MCTAVLMLSGCSMLGLGKFKWIEWTSSGEKYYLLKNCFLAAGNSLSPRQSFDHNMYENVSFCFVPANEKNHYVSKTLWYDPSGLEFRAIRQTHDKQQETKRGSERTPQGTTRIHSLPLKELYEHKRGLWKVELYLDDVLARRLPFTVH